MQYICGLRVWFDGAIMFIKVALWMLAVTAPIFGASAGLSWLLSFVAGL